MATRLLARCAVRWAPRPVQALAGASVMMPRVVCAAVRSGAPLRALRAVCVCLARSLTSDTVQTCGRAFSARAHSNPSAPRDQKVQEQFLRRALEVCACSLAAAPLDLCMCARAASLRRLLDIVSCVCARAALLRHGF